MDTVISGSISGVVSRIVANPFDVLKIRFQLQTEPIRNSKTSKYRGLLHAFRVVLAEEGWQGFMKGLTPGVWLYVLYNATQFTVHKQTKHYLTRNRHWTSRVGVDSIGGVCGGMVAVTITQPLAILKTRLSSQGNPKVYKTLRSAIYLMYRQEGGIRAYYQGFTPGLVAIASQMGLNFAIYSLTMQLAESRSSKKVRALEGFQGVAPVFCGGIAGFSSKALILPIDIVRRRIEVRGFVEARRTFGEVLHYNGIIDCFIKIYQHEGMLGFYKGTLPTLLKNAVTASCIFFVNEQVLCYYHKNH